MMTMPAPDTTDEIDLNCLSTEIRVRRAIMDLQAKLVACGQEVISVTIGGAPNFDVNIIHDER